MPVWLNSGRDFWSQQFGLIKSWLYLSVKIFTLTAVVGSAMGFLTNRWLAAILREVSKGEPTVFSIFSHNLTINIISIVGGLLLFASLPILDLSINGFVFGYVITALIVHSATPSIEVAKIFYGVSPHAIPELLTLFLSCALGMRMGFKEFTLKQNMALVVAFVPIVIILTYCAAYLEVNISGVLIRRVTSP